MRVLAEFPASTLSLLLLSSLTISTSATAQPYSAPERLHFNPDSQSPSSYSPGQIFRRAGGQKYECNPGTFSCRDIGFAQLCCNDGETCHRIDDIGFGSVGCCPKDTTCTGNLSGCGDDKVSCLKTIGGGCCNKGSMCTRYGCIVDPALGEEIGTEAEPSMAPTGAGIGAGGAGVMTETVVPTKTVTVEGNEETSLCDEGYRACAVAAGGGCCPEGYECGIKSCPAKVTLVATVVDGVLVTQVLQMPAETKRSQNVFVPVTGSDVGGVRVGWGVLMTVLVGMVVGGAWVL
ncbi:hypothetical protein EX30DRAFT_391905 [Ascodesmis nigricans]|uniref:GPI anchored protein n=1 Tax=Ascodesmis nigricans TaxID=341454 RepID=A0A4S2N5H5_9PEZI|nr:hypothetical protein EX30DRAFT_391905 [Ascodesmis nigricans]